MPVQVFPAKHGANVIEAEFVKDSMDVLLAAWPDSRFHELLQSSFDDDLPPKMISSTNGFVYSIVQAYGGHHHLKIRPEDVWFAIITQLSLYINKHAEELRDKFVNHAGKVTLRILYSPFDRHHFDFGRFARDMSHALEKSIKDPELREWVMPNFSTTTPKDQVIAAIIMMATLQKYFDYGCGIICGFPSVTLLGEREDYEKILAKIDKLLDFGDEAAHFASLLRPVIKRFIWTFDNPKAEDVINFWRRAMYFDDSVCGQSLCSGWITAFCCWNEDGDLTHRISETSQVRPDQEHIDQESNLVALDDHREERKGGDERTHTVKAQSSPYLSLDETIYPVVDRTKFAPGFARVPVHVEDVKGEATTEMVAGSVGISCSSSGETGDLDTMQPTAGWWIYAKLPGEHPDLAAFREKAEAKGLSKETIDEEIAEAHSTGIAPNDATIEVLLESHRERMEFEAMWEKELEKIMKERSHS